MAEKKFEEEIMSYEELEGIAGVLGNKVSRNDFRKNFDADNGTKIIR